MQENDVTHFGLKDYFVFFSHLISKSATNPTGVSSNWPDRKKRRKDQDGEGKAGGSYKHRAGRDEV